MTRVDPERPRPARAPAEQREIVVRMIIGGLGLWIGGLDLFAVETSLGLRTPALIAALMLGAQLVAAVLKLAEEPDQMAGRPPVPAGRPAPAPTGSEKGVALLMIAVAIWLGVSLLTNGAASPLLTVPCLIAAVLLFAFGTLILSGNSPV